MLRITLLASLLFLTSCGYLNRLTGYVKGYERTCIAGVSYLQFPSGASVEYTKDGKIKLCED